MDIEQWNAFRARTEADISLRPRHNPVVQVAAFAAGWWIADQDQKEKQAYKDAGLKRPLGARIASGIMTFLSIVIGGPVLLAFAALALAFVGIALWMIYAIAVVGLEAIIGPISFPGWWPDGLTPQR